VARYSGQALDTLGGDTRAAINGGALKRSTRWRSL
jgi:hypothetical protein